MTLFTDGLVQRPQRNILDDVASGQLDAAEAAFQQAWFENPTTAARRINELDNAMYGDVLQPEVSARGYTAPEVRAEPTSPLLDADEARKRVKDSGLSITVDDSGIREDALNILMERKREERQRQFVLENAPSSTVPVQLLSGFAASAIDPINVVSAFVPIVGEARYASMLARAGESVLARAGVRAGVGAIEGAAGAALVEPIVLSAAAQDQTDYDISDSLLNIAFGTVLGGGLHTAGGALSDLRRSRIAADAQSELPQIATAEAPKRSSLAEAISRGDTEPMVALRDSLARAIDADRPLIMRDAMRQAADELTPAIRAELQDIAAGKAPNVADMRAEAASIDKSLSTLDDSFKPRAKEFQQQRMSRKQAEQAARQSIQEERSRLLSRKDELSQALDANKTGELARADLARLSRGEIPEQFKQRIAERAGTIAAGFDLKPTARAAAENAPWHVREAALRSAVAQSVTGRDVDIESVFAMDSPDLRGPAMNRLKDNPRPRRDIEGESVSRQADEIAKQPDGTDLESAEQLLADELALTDEMAKQADYDVTPFYKEADQLIADANTYAAAYRAAAVCQLRN